MATNSGTKWMKFFMDAGLPSHVAANYSIIFTENRMQVDMLLDLNKEYLYDMGIRLMGDVISILRHARTAYTQAAQEKMHAVSVPTEYEEDAGMALPDPAAVRRQDHYMEIAQSIAPVSIQSIPTISHSRKNVISLKRKTEASIPVPVMKKPLSQELDYNTYALEKQRFSSDVDKISTTKSVFNRLGESSVSSSTDAVKGKGPSVFARLGPSTTVASEDGQGATGSDEPPLQYQGILKSSMSQREARDVRSRLGLKSARPTSSAAISTTSSDAVRLIRKSLEDSRKQRQHIDAAVGMLRRKDQTRPSSLLRRLGGTSQSSISPFLKKTILTGQTTYNPPEHRIVKKPKNERTVFDRLGPTHSS